MSTYTVNEKTIRVTTTIVHKVDCSDLNDFIEAVYGQSYSIEADQEIGHDEIVEIEALKGENTELVTAELDLLSKGGGDYVLQNYSTFDILCDLADRDILPEQTYSIETC